MIQPKDLCKSREVYAVHHGDHAGQLFVVVKITKESVNCLALPDMKNIKVPIESFNTGRNTDIIKYVERLSSDIFRVTKAQYKKNANENSNN